MNGSATALLQIAAYLLLLVALLACGALFLRKGFNGRLDRKNAERKLQIAEMRALGNRQFLVVAEYEQRKVLLGVCPGRIDYLCTLSGGEESSFAAMLSRKTE